MLHEAPRGNSFDEARYSWFLLTWTSEAILRRAIAFNDYVLVRLRKGKGDLCREEIAQNDGPSGRCGTQTLPFRRGTGRNNLESEDSITALSVRGHSASR